ncbi:hypothetical protein [Microcystis phage Mwe-Yong1]|nr:hypothetical protein [Microcystis phage Mwe-Yong1]
MTFRAKRDQLMDRLRWAPARGEKRRQLEEALRDLVRQQLERDVAARSRPAPAQHTPYVRPARTPYWLDPDDEAHP